jgi:hypothetical protein
MKHQNLKYPWYFYEDFGPWIELLHKKRGVEDYYPELEMSEKEIITFVDSMDMWDKLRIYMNFMIDMVALKHQCSFVDTLSKHYHPKAFGEPERVVHGVHFRYLHKDLMSGDPYESFTGFFGESHKEVVDVGENWEKQNFAQRYIQKFTGGYRWFRENYWHIFPELREKEAREKVIKEVREKLINDVSSH